MGQTWSLSGRASPRLKIIAGRASRKAPRVLEVDLKMELRRLESQMLVSI